MKNKARDKYTNNKILIVHPDANANSKGGSQINALEIAAKLNKNFQVKFLSCYKLEAANSGRLIGLPRSVVERILTALNIHKLSKHIYSNLPHKIESFSCALSLIYHIYRYKPNYVYPNDGYWGLFFCSLYRKFRPIKIIYTEHAGLLFQQKIIKKNLSLKPNLMVVLDEKTLSFVKTYAPQQHVRAIPNGIDLTNYYPTSRAPNDDKIKVLIVARLNKNSHKRIELLIDAIAELSERFHLTLCGGGRDEVFYKRLCEKKIPNRFELISTTFDKIPSIYAAHNIFSLPSESEPFGKVYIEAMAAGLGVVAPDDEQRRNLIGNAGIFCDVLDASAYAQAIEIAASQNFKEKSLEQASKYSWDSIIQQYQSAIISLSDKSL